MKEITQIDFLDIEEVEEYKNFINKILTVCFKEENIYKLNLYISITLTDPSNIRKYNNEFRNIDKETDVLSFPMFEKDEIQELIQIGNNNLDVLGDIVISLERVKEQAVEYGNSFEREFAYMLVHGFYHLMGYDHMQEDDKKQMRAKEENILEKLDILRGAICDE